MNNYKKVSVTTDARTEFHDQLGLTGAQISINMLPAGAGVPFVHSHKQNEEIYFILDGEGYAVIDGENVELKTSDWLRISSSAKRQFFASEKCAIKFICIQVKENSLEGYTMTDAVV